MTKRSAPKGAAQSGAPSGKGPRLRFTPPNRPPDEVRRLGEEAARTLDSTVFVLAVQSTVEELKDNIMTTQPHESQKREFLYLQLQALGEVLLGLKLFADEAARLSQERLAEEGANQRSRDLDEIGAPYGELMQHAAGEQPTYPI